MASAELQTAIQMLRDNPPIQGDTLLEMRSSMQAAVANLPRPHDVECETVDAGGVPAEWVRAPGSRGDRALIHLHGGGYVMGSLDSHRGLAAHLSRSTRAPVLLADYRLAPENPYPAAVEDGVAAYRHVVRSGTDPGRIAISGDSAGGGLTVATLVALRDEGDALPAAGVCISPWLDLTQSGESFRTKVDEDVMVTQDLLEKASEAYCKGSDPRAPTASPLFADLAGLPPLLVQVGTAEMLLDDSRRFAERAKQAGVDVTLEVADEMIHVWHTFADFVPEAKEAIGRIADFLEPRWS